MLHSLNYIYTDTTHVAYSQNTIVSHLDEKKIKLSLEFDLYVNKWPNDSSFY